jgi:hypothetical protein
MRHNCIGMRPKFVSRRAAGALDQIRGLLANTLCSGQHRVRGELICLSAICDIEHARSRAARRRAVDGRARAPAEIVHTSGLGAGRLALTPLHLYCEHQHLFRPAVTRIPQIANSLSVVTVRYDA